MWSTWVCNKKQICLRLKYVTAAVSYFTATEHALKKVIVEPASTVP